MVNDVVAMVKVRRMTQNCFRITNLHKVASNVLPGYEITARHSILYGTYYVYYVLYLLY